VRERINNDVKAAMKAGEKDRVATLRLINAAIQSAEIEAETSGKPKLSEADFVAVLSRMVKQRRDSIEQYKAGGRPELAAKEAAEIVIIEAYLPKQLSEAEVKDAIAALIKETGAASAKDMGKVMGLLKSRYAGQLDFGKASALVKGMLS
jgi:hypothetical protein